MADEKKNSEYIDVAKNAAYLNQSKLYCNEFLNWRSSGNNPYAYSYVKRINEHSYVDGQGYVMKSPGDVEKKVLRRCCRLVTMTVFTMILFALVEMIYSAAVVEDGGYTVTKVPYGQPLDSLSVPLGVCAVVSALRVLKYLTPILICVLDTRLPRAVMFPEADHRNPDIFACAMVMSLMATIFCLQAESVLAGVLGSFGARSYRLDFIYSDNVFAVILFGIVNCIAVSILNEILFRGVILQTFRQFGDLFAFIVCCTAEIFSGLDLSSTGCTACISIIITLFTLRTGSIRAAVGMRIGSSLLVFILNIVEVYLPSGTSEMTEIIICFIIVAVSLIIYARVTTGQNFSFNIDSSRTNLSLERKLIVFFSNSPIMLWLIMVISGGIFLM